MSINFNSKVKSCLRYLWFFLSALSLMFLLCVFRPLRIKIFLFALSILLCTYFIIKKRASIFCKSSKTDIIVSLCLESVCFFDFYFNAIHIRPGSVETILVKLQLINLLDENVAYAIVGILAALVGFLFTRTMVPYIIKGYKEIFSIVKKFRIQFFILLAINIIALIAIIRANYYYTDDLGRTIYGYEMTGDFSRYIANILSELFHGNSWLADISPLPQLIALFIISLSEIILLSVFSSLLNKEPSRYAFVALIPIGLSPYFLSCLSYKYDAPYMALSVLVSIIPLVFYSYNFKIYSTSVFIGTIIMCTTYQVSSGLLPMIVLIMSLLMWIKKDSYRKIFSFLLSSAISYFIALIVFRIAIMSPVSKENYVDVGVSLTNLLPNTINYFKLLNSDFPTIWMILCFTVFALFIILIINKTKQNKIISGLISIVVCICAFILSFGAYIVFNNPLTDTRSFYGLGVFLSIMCCIIFLNNGYYIGKLSVVAISGFFIIYSFIYGNALSIQKNYIDFRTEQIINDCNSIGLLNENSNTKLAIKGTAGYHRAVKNMIQEYPVLGRQIRVLLSDPAEWDWGTYQLREYYGLNVEPADISNIQTSDCDILKDTYYYTIYKAKDIIILQLNDVESNIQ